MGIWRHSELDLSFLSMVKTCGILLLTTIVAFLYLILPYVLYLLLLPRRWVNSRFDKIFTFISFILFTFYSLSEETISVLLWMQNATDLEFIDHPFGFYYKFLSASYPIFWLIGLISFFSLLISYLCRRFLFTSLAVPGFGYRLYHSTIYVAVCLLAYANIDINKLEMSTNRFNRELASEGSYNIIKHLNEKEIALIVDKNVSTKE